MRKNNLLFLVVFLLRWNSSFAQITDTIYKVWNLKGGYRLVIGGNKLDSTTLILEHGANKMFLDASEPKLGLDVFGYVYKDFDRCYVMATHEGADLINIEIIDKEKGATMIWGKTPFYTDTIKQHMFFEGKGGKAGKLILYDFKNEKFEMYPSPRDTKCFCCFCWKCILLTDKEIQIEYVNLQGKSAVKNYERK